MPNSKHKLGKQAVIHMPANQLARGQITPGVFSLMQDSQIWQPGDMTEHSGKGAQVQESTMKIRKVFGLYQTLDMHRQASKRVGRGLTVPSSSVKRCSLGGGVLAWAGAVPCRASGSMAVISAANAASSGSTSLPPSEEGAAAAETCRSFLLREEVAGFQLPHIC